MRAGELEYAHGNAAQEGEGAQAYAAGVHLYALAADRWAEIGRTRDEAHALYAAAKINYWSVYDWHGASDLAAKAATAYRLSGEHALRANALLLQAKALTEVLNERDDKESLLNEVAELLEQSYSVHERLGNTRELAEIRYFNALSNLNAGRLEQARDFYALAAQLYAKSEDWPKQRNVLLDLAVIDIDLGNTDAAIEALDELLAENEARHPDASDKDNFTATVLDQLGAAHRADANIDEALNAFSAARDIHAAVGDLHGKSESLRGIAAVYVDSGDLVSARDFLRQAEEAARTANNGRVLSAVQTTLGNIAYSDGDYESARTFYSNALDLAPEGAPVRVYRQLLLAKAYLKSHEYLKARELARAALHGAESAEALRYRGDALQEIGRSHLAQQDARSAIDPLESALSVYRDLDLSDGQADVLNALALALAQLATGVSDRPSRSSILNDAVSRSEEALKNVEALLGTVSAPELRAYYAATRQGYYETHIELLMDLQANTDDPSSEFIAAALATSERARARMTLDLLNEASVDLQQSVDPKVADERRRLLNQLAVLQSRRDSLLVRSGQATSGELAELSTQLAAAKNELDLLEVKLRRTSARYKALTSPATLTFGRLQELVGDDSVLLQYSLGEQKSFVWVVTQDSIRVVELADRATIEVAAQHAFARLQVLDSGAGARAEESQTLQEISRLVIDPVASLISDRRLLVVADGALHYLPFQVLTIETDGRPVRLMETHEVVALPSMSVLEVLRSRASARPNKSLAVFADPVFERSDPRFPAGVEAAVHDAKGPGTDSSFLTRSSLTGYLARLPGTRIEATEIAELVAGEEPFVATGFRASRAEVLGHDLSEYRYLHFATHGEVNAEIPALSALVFSRFDEQGNEQNGYLRLHDIYNLDINADLVVLSACRTALGADIRGEGLIGLTQGFFYAGARSLLISLWNVPDRATAELMQRFYRQMLEYGSSPAGALREAQRSMAADQQWADPYFWGAFKLLGDWK
jgi:CHAT domain-containing protein